MLDPTLFDAEEVLAGLIPWVEVESPTHHVAGVNRMMDLAARESEALGGTVERVPGRDGYGDIVIGRITGRDGANAPSTLLLSHLDTIHPVGTLAGRLALRREGDRYYGPGIYDMKGGVRIALHALAILKRTQGGPAKGVTFMFVPDEEVGSPSSRERPCSRNRQT